MSARRRWALGGLLIVLSLSACQKTASPPVPTREAATLAGPTPDSSTPTPTGPTLTAPPAITDTGGAPIIVAAAVTFTSTSQAPSATAQVTPCSYAWHFEPAPNGCADSPPMLSSSTAQEFESALLISIENSQPMSFRAAVYALIGSGSFWASYPVIQPITPDPLLTAPAGMFMPDSAFYDTWSNGNYEAGTLKDAIGWPVGEASHYRSDVQCDNQTNIYLSRCFIGAPDGRTILLSNLPSFGRNGITWSYWEGEP